MPAPKQTLAEQFPHIPDLADPLGLYALMQAYLAWLRERNYSEQTLVGRELFLCSLLDWCGQRGVLRPTEITKPMLERYQRHLYHTRKKNGDPLSFRSQYNRIVAIRTWFKWLARRNHILTNPASDLELPKLEKRLPKAILSEREAETVLNQPDTGEALGLRDRAILEVLYSTGIRRSELVNLKVQDIDPERGTLIVRQGKGKKDRMIPIGERAAAWVEKYRADVRPAFVAGRDEGVLFLTRTGEGMSPNNLTTLARGYIEQSKIGKKGACHLFRHTMATLMLENGADIRFIQAMLGHVCLSTTEMYTQVSIAKLKEIHTLTHPARLSRLAMPRSLDPDEPEATESALFTALAAEAAEEG
ncbi:integrase/recombinase XerD [Fluviicoccus keumensis]|uniref:Integrase/recombinase XerD n=1 Tax=Fluviicoccus keumensis TaxID=1435465 RepID=A0A4Q7YP44_9GAMM|nr:site-specific tyrosine recombinase XerC [Fluviicoccus keumensis]RZU38479.1 integrase/recombinase XerD [Fluviicoccus keumensis]RZU38483.1 integrase/recombinase XerD [Fluviicoccus keumensis]